MWIFVFAAALAAELVPPWDAHGTAISPRTPLDDVLIDTRAGDRRKSFLQLTKARFILGAAQFQLYTLVRSDLDVVKRTTVVAEKGRIRSQIRLYDGDNTLLDARTAPGDLVLLTWGSDAASYATVLGFDEEGVLQKLAQDIPVRIGLSELRLTFPAPGQLRVQGRPATAVQMRWLGRHTLRLLPAREPWVPREDAIPVGQLGSMPPAVQGDRAMHVSEYALRLGQHGTGWTATTLWVDAPQGQVPLLDLPKQNGRPVRIRLRAFRRMHGHVFWAEAELVVAGVEADVTYYLGWILSLRRDEARVLADQIPIRSGGLEETRLSVEIPTGDTLVIEASTSQLSYWQRKWLGTWTLK